MWAGPKMIGQDGWIGPIGWSPDGGPWVCPTSKLPFLRELDCEFC